MTNDSKTHQVDSRILNMSVLLKDMLEEKDDIYAEEIELPTITSEMMQLVIQYCAHFDYVKDPYIEYPLKSNVLSQVLEDRWEADFITSLSQEKVISLLQAANYLNIPALFEVCCARIGADFRGKSFDSVKKDFGLESVTYTPEDEEQMIKEFGWILNEAHKKVEQLDKPVPTKKANG